MVGWIASTLLVEGAILLIATLLRLWALDLKPAHFDEGINGWFVDQMRDIGFYRYDPENYHGPLYFYVLFLSLSLLGRNLWALRLPAVLSSIASVWMALRFDRFIGITAARLGALALAVSPAAVFYGRYAIHESMFVLALMITISGMMGLWQSGDKRDLAVMMTGGTLLLLLKETAAIHLGCLVLAGFCLHLLQKTILSDPVMPPAKPCWGRTDLFWCLGSSLLTLLFFYSGTFLNWGGIPDFGRAYLKWFHTGTGAGGHVKAEYQVGPFNYYWLALMGRYEWPSLIGLIYAVRLALPSPPLQRFLALYGVGVLLVYSYVPYKTPWCIISILWPLCLLFGGAVAETWRRFGRFRPCTVIIVAGILVVTLAKAVTLNFSHFADPSEPYVYVQTLPEISVLTEPLLGIAKHDPRGHSMSGEIILESYYPLPWIFGDFNRIGYYGKNNLPAALDGDFIVALTSQQKLIEERIKGPYFRRRFHLRDSMEECTVWFRESLFNDWFHEAGHGKPDRVDSLKDKNGIKTAS
jgi:uncharacterized protein (TIGR03663 family)